MKKSDIIFILGLTAAAVLFCLFLDITKPGWAYPNVPRTYTVPTMTIYINNTTMSEYLEETHYNIEGISIYRNVSMNTAHLEGYYE